jgi:hypothetical protein
MRSYIFKKYFGLYVCLLLIAMIFLGADAKSQTSRSKITSPLTITGSDQDAECMVANAGTSNVAVNIKLISAGSEIINDDHILLPNGTASVFTTSVISGSNFFCVFNYSGRNSEIRAAARVFDPSGVILFPQRAEATEDR